MMKRSVKVILTVLAAATLLTTAACSNSGSGSTVSETTSVPSDGTGASVVTPSQPSVATPSIAQPSVTTPSVAEPSVVTPSVVEPSVVTPSVAEPSVVTPSVAEPSVVTPSTPVSTASQATPQSGSQMIGTYSVGISDEYKAMMTSMTEQEQLIVQYLLNSTLTLNADGTLTYSITGQETGGTWSDNGDGTVTLDIVGGNKATFIYQDGVIYNPDDQSTYFQKM